jgi:alpha-beta hydrolase superfamily lysophospholipase
MKQENFSFKAEDGKDIFFYRWVADEAPVRNGSKNGPKAVVHIIHGMGEHAGRYAEFADALSKDGFTVYSADQRGHGKTAGSRENLGHFADKNGWFTVVDDLKNLTEIIEKENPRVPVFLFGHSAGAMLALDYIVKYPEKIRGVVMTGTSGDPGLLGYAGIILAKPIIKKGGPGAKSPLHKKLLFEKYNSYFKPNRTSADWISRDEKAVDKMLADPYCFQLFSAEFYADLARASLRVNSSAFIKKLPKALPFLLASGTECAVGAFTKGVKSVYRSFIKAGLKNVKLNLYKGARHEIINEINREEVIGDIISWLNKILSSS